MAVAGRSDDDLTSSAPRSRGHTTSITLYWLGSCGRCLLFLPALREILSTLPGRAIGAPHLSQANCDYTKEPLWPRPSRARSSTAMAQSVPRPRAPKPDSLKVPVSLCYKHAAVQARWLDGDERRRDAKRARAARRLSSGRRSGPPPGPLRARAVVVIKLVGPAEPALVRASLWMTSVVNINDVLDGHVSLDIACIDRLYLNAYIPNMQVGGQVNQFCRHLGQPIASPAVIEKIGNRFRRDVDAFAKAQRVPVLHLAEPDRTRWDDRKLDHVQPYMGAAEKAGRYGVVAIVAAQEFQWVFSATKKTDGKAVWFDWAKTERRVSCYYFYLHDREFGPGFIRILHLLPVPGQGVAERARMGQTPGPPSLRPIYRTGQRLRNVRACRASPGHLRPFRAGRRPSLLRALD